MSKRDFLKLADLSRVEAEAIFVRAASLKSATKGSHLHLLAGRSVAVIFEKASTRTRVSFEVGIAQLGAQPVVLGVDGSQLGRGEPLRDTARVLSRFCDAIAYRTYGQTKLEELARWATVPVINALSDSGHPIQVLCDVFTIGEHVGNVQGKRVAFIGDCSSNMARSWIEAAVLFDFELVLAAPDGYFPPEGELKAAGSHVTCTNDPLLACRGASVINTDVWASMGQEAEAEARRDAFDGFQVNATMLAEVASNAIVLHCLPAHRGEEIDDATLEGSRSRVWDQAENRLHVQKALMCFLIGV